MSPRPPLRRPAPVPAASRCVQISRDKIQGSSQGSEIAGQRLPRRMRRILEAVAHRYTVGECKRKIRTNTSDLA